MTNETTAHQLRRGSSGVAVAQLQQALLTMGFDPGQVDGVFGARTEAAVKELQAAHHLGVDGIVGPDTWRALEGTPEAGNASDVDDPSEPGPANAESAPAPTQTTDWATVDGDERMRYVMERLIDHYHYPINGAAGLVGNLWAESGVIPQRIEGSRADTPMRAKDFEGNTVDFTAEQVMNRDRANRLGPALPGVGLARWTSAGRRSGLFGHTYNGVEAGANVLFDMDAEIDYLDHELSTSYVRVHRVLTGSDVTVDDACDEVLYNFEVPGAIIENGSKLPRTDPRVQEVFQRRRAEANRALQVYDMAAQ